MLVGSIFYNRNISDSRVEGIKLQSLCSIVWHVILIISQVSLARFNCHAQEEYSCLCKWIGMCTCLGTSGGIKYQFLNDRKGRNRKQIHKCVGAFSTYIFILTFLFRWMLQLCKQLHISQLKLLYLAKWVHILQLQLYFFVIGTLYYTMWLHISHLWVYVS